MISISVVLFHSLEIMPPVAVMTSPVSRNELSEQRKAATLPVSGSQ